ncbi:MAG: biotin--[acetyl-CoA-carboxylase] ligase [Cytophagales bacterium]|nr:biotin--[acetyl-CoA-carboxylase] ligase [Armatimonadota bacterium]
MTFGSPLYRYDTVGSTQDVARDLARAGEPPGTVVTAQAQRTGRGRRGKTWQFPRGANVCLTTIGPAVPLESAWQIALLAGLAAAEGVRDAAPEAAVKVRFPNDVFLAGGKLGGILVETLPAGAVGFVIPLIGVGINVKADVPLPLEIARSAVSLEAGVGRVVEVRTVEAAVLKRLGARWEEWENDGFAATATAWKRLADPDALRTFIVADKPLPCRVLEIAPGGEVTLEARGGERHQILASQILFGDD